MPSRSELEHAASRRRLLREWLAASPGVSAEVLSRRLESERPDLAVSARQIRRDIAGFEAAGKNGRPSDVPKASGASTVAVAAEWAATVLSDIQPALLDGLVATHLAAARDLEALAVDGVGPVAARREVARLLGVVFDLVRSAAEAAGSDRKLSADERIAKA